MTKEELLLDLWAESNLAFMHGSASALVSPKIRALLQALNDQHGADLVEHQQEKLERKRAAG